MKYTIEGFNQVELVNGTQSNDAVILRWFVDFMQQAKWQ